MTDMAIARRVAELRTDERAQARMRAIGHRRAAAYLRTLMATPADVRRLATAIMALELEADRVEGVPPSADADIVFADGEINS